MYGDGLQKRSWLHVDDHADAIGVVLERGESGTCLQRAGRRRRADQSAVTELILEELGKPWSLVRAVADRAGHDRRYAMDGRRHRRARMAAEGDVRGRPARAPSLVRRARRVVAAARDTAVRRLLPAAVRVEARADRQRHELGGRATLSGRIAITGARGRLGRAIVDVLGPRALPWDRSTFDLDQPDQFAPLLRDARPGAGHPHGGDDRCRRSRARSPELATARNGAAVGALAAASRGVGTKLVVISTNEVFDGRRTDGLGYAEDDRPDSCSPYGASKLAGEEAARAEYGTAAGLWIVRTSWLFGPPGNDFPTRIVAAADALPRDQPLPMVADEHGSPTSTADLAAAIVTLVEIDRGRDLSHRQRRLHHPLRLGRAHPRQHSARAEVAANSPPGVRPSVEPSGVGCAAAIARHRNADLAVGHRPVLADVGPTIVGSLTPGRPCPWRDQGQRRRDQALEEGFVLVGDGGPGIGGSGTSAGGGTQRCQVGRIRVSQHAGQRRAELRLVGEEQGGARW